MATMERTWQFDANRAWTPASAVEHTRYMLWYLKAFLKGEIGGAASGLWTCVGSSDASTANVSDNNDRWGSPYNGAKIVRAAAGVAHSWIVLKSPNFTAGAISGVPFYLLLDFGTAADPNFIVAFSKAGFTGGSTSTRPTATDEWGWGASGGVPTSVPLNDGSSGVSLRMHGGLCTDGSFYILHTRDGLNYVPFGMFFSVLANVKANDQYPIATFLNYRSTAGSLCQNESGSAQTVISQTSTITTALGVLWGKNYAGANTLTPILVPAAQAAVSLSGIFGTNGMINSDGADGSWVDFPVWVAWVTGGNPNSLKGRLQDFALAPDRTVLAAGSVEPASGTITSVSVGGMWWPMNAALTL